MPVRKVPAVSVPLFYPEDVCYCCICKVTSVSNFFLFHVATCTITTDICYNNTVFG
jgi:hypothetical protein